MSKSNWGILTFILILFFTLLFLLGWQRFPLFLDIYYHLNVMRGFELAGGIVNHDFWELAPVGYVHIYPPLFHLLLLIPYKLGFNLLFIARFFSTFSFPLTLVTLYFTISRLFSKKLGFFVTTAACIPYTFFLKAAITIPANLALIFILLAFYALERKRMFAASILLSLSFYSHLGLPWIGALTFLSYGLLRKEKMKSIIWILLLTLIFSSPMLFHILFNLDKLESVLGLKVGENELIEFYPLLYLFAIIGLLKLKVKGIESRSLFFFALFIGFLPMAINYRYRLISAEGLLPVIFFAGIGLERCYDSLCKFFKTKKLKSASVGFYLLFCFILINFFCPTISLYNTLIPPHKKKELSFYLRDSTIVNSLPSYKKHFRPLEVSLYNEDMEELIGIITKNTEKGDIIYSNYTYIGGLLSAFSGRANALHTFYEVKVPPYRVNKIRSSKLLIWLKDPIRGFDGVLRIYVDKYKFKKIAQTKIAIILINPNAPKMKPVKPVVSTPLALLLLFCALLVICYDLALARKRFNNLPKSSLE